MEWILLLGVLSLAMGGFLLFSRESFLRFGKVMNMTVGFIDKKIRVIRIPAGMIFLVVGAWIISVAFNYAELWHLHFIGALAVIVGFFYLFFPQWLEWLGVVLNRVLFSVDDFATGFRKGLGVFFLVAAVYFFYSAYLTIR